MALRVLSFLRSPSLALVALGVLALGLALSTVFVSELPEYLSRAAWLKVNLGALVVILAASMAHPSLWRRSKFGVLIIHTGLLLAILGAAVTWRCGRSGLVVLNEGTSTGQMFLRHHYELHLQQRTGQQRNTEVLRFPQLDDGAVGEVLRAPISGTSIAILNWMKSARPELDVVPAVKGDETVAALKLSIRQPYSEKPVTFWLADDGQHTAREVGGIRFELYRTSNAKDKEQLLQKVRGEQQAMITVRSPLSGEVVELADKPDQKVALKNPAAVVRVLRVFQHWIMDVKGDSDTAGPTDLADGPKNPAVEVEVTRGDTREKQWVFALHNDWGAKHSNAKMPKETHGLELKYLHPGETDSTPCAIFMLDGEKGSVAFRGASGVEEKALAAGLNLQCPTAGNQALSVAVTDVVPAGRARIIARPDPANEGIPAVNVRVSREGKGEALWIFAGSPDYADLGSAGAARLDLIQQTRPLDFDITLNKMVADFYPDSGIPRAYESHLVLYDPLTGTQEQAVVSMNHPLHFRGARIYQTSYRRTEEGQQSTMEVAEDPAGGGIIFAGVITLIVGVLYLYIQKAREKRARKRQLPVSGSRLPVDGSALSGADRITASHGLVAVKVKLILVALSVSIAAQLSALAGETPAPIAAVDAEAIRGLTVLYSGRVQPFDSFAREQVRVVVERRSIDGQEPFQTALSMIFDAETWMSRPLFFIPQGEMREIIGGTDQMPLVSANVVLDPKTRQRIGVVPDSRSALRKQIEGIYTRATVLNGAAHAIGLVPDTRSKAQREWLTAADLMDPIVAKELPAAADAWQKIASAYRARNGADLKAAVDALVAAQAQPLAAWRSNRADAATDAQVKLELTANKLSLPRRSAWLYLLTFALAGLLCLRPRSYTLWACLGLLAIPFATHTASIILRWTISGYMPLTNLFESGVVLAWGGVLLGGILAALRRSLSLAVSSAFVGTLVMFLMENLPVAPSEIRPIQAVLNSYWLDIHVVMCMISYGGLLLAAVLGGAYLGRAGRARFRPVGDGSALALVRTELAGLEEQLYWLIVIAWVFLGAGIITGAIWAHHAWGRYWGWDPKEVWSLVTWVVYAFFLHARIFWGWRGWKSALFSVLGFTAVIFTYFGVAFLLPGLHSYASR